MLRCAVGVGARFQRPCAAVGAASALPTRSMRLFPMLETRWKRRRRKMKSGIVRTAQSAAHHIVAGRAMAAQAARATLQRLNITNGVFLPRSVKSLNPDGAAVHSTLHTNAYYAGVNNALAAATSRTEAMEILSRIRADLLSGGYP
ncbi:AHH domain-containing protein [Microbacterium sp. SSM24]|uniref:AHH domain-containing protein n=1 Tax=Microbacterium sp. SSM24 TaxID=2991714 RepID=UPI0039B3C118